MYVLQGIPRHLNEAQSLKLILEADDWPSVVEADLSDKPSTRTSSFVKAKHVEKHIVDV